uniref:Uncharacterized protein n=1 Tax=Candidatus Methanogaster sp. ANME-2c ERB4 TaxID=2759911 RepID=A0A7G9YI74_9EURY|nr:hypothetical protein LDJELIEA_00006 [Methanosarcinales archaeon ANME-2c ERB4]
MSSGLALETEEAHGDWWKRYPAYRDSGVEWLGAVPEGWRIMRAKYCSKINMGQSPSSEDCSINRIGLPFLQGNAEFGAVSLRERIGRLVRKTQCFSKRRRMLECSLQLFQFYWNFMALW